MRSSWTDERLDDLNLEVDQGFARLDDKIDRLDERLTGRIDRLTERIDKLIHALLVVSASLSAAFLAFMAAVIGLIITQL